MTESTLTAANFALVAQLLRDQCGLVLEPGKEYLVKSRLAPVAQRHKFAGVDQLVERLRGGSVNGLVTDVVEAMVTTETFFFRDIHPFETLKKSVLPELFERRNRVRQLNIWCAASSSGQEPYSIAILLHEYFPELSSWRINISATDISQHMLERSRAGSYSQVEVNRGLPTPLLLKWFRQEGGHWRLDDRVRTAVTFSKLNLIQPLWPAMPAWDLLFLRNVMIYFDTDMKRSILSRVARVLSPDGYLLLGGAETTLNLNDEFYRVEVLKSGFYQLKSLLTSLESDHAFMSKSAASAVLPPEVIEAFTSSAVTALEELMQLVAIPTDGLAIKTPLVDDAVVAVMRLLRPVPGTMTLVLPTNSARRLSEAYLPAGTELTDEIINDVAGELANVIAGQAKTILKGTPYHFTLSIPVVSRHACCGQSPGVAMTLAVETTLLLLLVDLGPCQVRDDHNFGDHSGTA